MADSKKFNPDFSHNLIVNLTFQFFLDMVKFSALFESKSKFAIANQIIRSGTSTGANVGESQHAESKSDFIHKMKVPAKETDETEYWLLIASQSEYYPNCDDLLTKILSIIKGSVKDYWHINGWL